MEKQDDLEEKMLFHLGNATYLLVCCLATPRHTQYWLQFKTGNYSKLMEPYSYAQSHPSLIIEWLFVQLILFILPTIVTN